MPIHPEGRAPVRSRRRGLLLVTALALVSAVAIVGALAPWTGGPREAGTPIATARVALEVIHRPVPAVTRVPQGGDTARMTVQQRMVAATVADLNDFWDITIPALADTVFEGLTGGVTAIDSAVSSASAPCVARADQAVGNAFYCPSSDGIVFDSATLVPVVLSRYGPAGLATTFAHEYGHVIQARIGPTSTDRAAAPDEYPSLVIEAQGDCYAGAFMAWVTAGHAGFLAIPDEALIDALGPLVDFADPVTVSRTSVTAHGLAMDRWLWFDAGFRDGAGVCGEMTMGTLDPILGRGVDPTAPWTQQDFDTPRFATAEDLVRATRDSLATFDPTLTIRAADTSGMARFGQFAEATALVRAAAEEASAPLGDEAPLIAACHTGAWVGHLFAPGSADTLGTWPSDADEALFAVLHRADATFAEVTSFTDGYRGGAAACPALR